MAWLRRNAWVGLLALASLGAVVGLIDVANGVWYQAIDVTGRSIDRLTAESADAVRLADFAVRIEGVMFMAFAVAMGAVLAFGLRQGLRWAWWAAWALPASTVGVAVVHAAYGATGPATSGTVIGILQAALLLTSAPRRTPALAPGA